MALKSAADGPATGTVIEARVDKGFGVVVTALVQSGQLKIGDLILAGGSWGRVRRILSDIGEDIENAGPSTPVQVLFYAHNCGSIFELVSFTYSILLLLRLLVSMAFQWQGRVSL